MIWFLVACTEDPVLMDTSSMIQDTQLEFGFCDESEVSHLPVGTVDCVDDICFVPAGEFWMGSANAEDECPVRLVHLDDYYIDAFEVTNNRWNDCVRSGGCLPMPSQCLPYQGGDNINSPVILPVVCITWTEATKFCTWTGGRLPTEAEWEKASRGIEGATFAWGQGSPTCTFEHSPEQTKNGANFRLATIHCYQNVSPVGYYVAARSPYGLWDTNGNVFEWTADYYDANYYESAPSINPTGPTEDCNLTALEPEQSCEFRVLRGGAFNTTEDVIRSSARSFAPTDLIDDNIGLRCAYDSR